jgi:hypothetical protein
MHDDPLIGELRHIRRTFEEECEDNHQKYYEYLSQSQRKYMDRLIRRRPKLRLKMKEHEA